MLILGIDTSCDDTCIALLEIKNRKFEIFSNIVSSQVKLHAKYGGVYPFLAKREHKKNLPIVFKKATKGIDLKKIDLIGVTVGPGLEPCLWEGINFAKNLAKRLKKKIVPVNHLEAHILVNFVDLNSKFKIQNAKLKFKIKNLFPAVCLVVSGGHTQLILMEDIGKYKILGETRDDAAGECFDKTARLLGLGYPGGPAIAKMATKFKIQNSKFKIKLPRPMISQKNYDFSFSGLKTAVLYDFKSRSKKERSSKEYKIEMAREIQQAIIDVLIFKTLKAAREFNAKSIILGGGVAANEELRRQFKTQNSKLKTKFFVPPPELCTDNGLMVAVSAFFNQNKIKKPAEISAAPNLKI
jgi:N6-L-threonylcarbamoyladenine synthase